MRRYIFAILCTVLISCSAAAFAAAAPGGEPAEISGRAEAGSIVTADVYYRGKGPADMENASKEEYLQILAFRGQTTASKKGKYEISFRPAADTAYTVYLQTNGHVSTYWFPFEPSEIANGLMQAKDAEEINQIIKENTSTFSEVTSLSAEDAEACARIMLQSLRTQGIQTLAQAEALYKECVFLNTYLATPGMDVQPYLGLLKAKNIPFEKLFYRPYITDTIRNEMLGALADATIGENVHDLESILGEAFVLSVIQNNVGVANMREVMEAFSAEIGFEPRYMTARNYLNIYGGVFSSYEALKPVFFSDSFLYIMNGQKQAAVTDIQNGDILVLTADIKKTFEVRQDGILVYAIYQGDRLLQTGGASVSIEPGETYVSAELPFRIENGESVTVKGFFLDSLAGLQPYTEAVELKNRD